MKNKRIYIIVAVLIGLLSITACKKEDNENKHQHEWISATCEIAKTCATCGITEGSSLEHEWVEASCELPKMCFLCGLTEGVENGHNWIEKDLLHKKHCSICNMTEGTSILEDILARVPKVVLNKVNLPTTYDKYTITWKSLDMDIMLDDGTIVYSTDVKNAKMGYQVLEDNNVVAKGDIDIIVNPVYVSLGAYEIAYKYYVSKLDSGIAKDVALIKRDYNGCSVKYISMDESIITSDGKVTQTKENQQTIMKIYVISNGIAVMYPVEVTVVEFSDSQRLDFSRGYIDEVIESYKNGLISVLPTYVDAYDVELYWNTDVAEFLVLDGYVLTPFEKTDVNIICTLKRGTTTVTNRYKLEDVGGTITEDEYLQKLIDYMTKVDLKGSINHLHPEYNDELFLDYQERINSYGVLNLATTSININKDYFIDDKDSTIPNLNIGSKVYGLYKPVVSQEKLNEVMYEGYKMPNDSNVLWITVHESAMTTNGHTAKFLAELQKKNTNGGADASWHYQVDAYSIYQSYADNTIGWHAGDGTSTAGNGNNNAIGIEMCVNQDGNYEGTITNNAKLVASLLLKYNLGLANVKKHQDHSGKECPSYLIRTARWQEFMLMVQKEYLIQKYLSDATIKYTLTTDNLSKTEDVLNNLFIKGDNGLYFNKPVNDIVSINFEIEVIKNSKTYKASSVFSLRPDTK